MLQGERAMTVSEQIQQHLQKLPPSVQAEVLDFVEYLLAKASVREERAWSDGSLALAMHGMEDEATPHYTTADVKMVFP
ncbi:DUF2281 domain-containing protein [Candidatus Chloroploca asiatica]|nr:DUF2281 domain-containing protein [Candidatus Chloroploca asiatica]